MTFVRFKNGETMRTRVKLLVTVVFGITLLPVAAQAQAAMKPVADSGMLTLGLNQVLRLTVATGDVNGDEVIRVRFRRMEYMEEGNIYRVASSNMGGPLTLTSGEATSIDIPYSGSPVRGVVLSNSRSAKVVGIVFDTSTQRIVAICTFIPD
jgi:hypothetical protein